MKHAEDQEVEDTSDPDVNNISVTESPEVLLLCALAARKEALPDLCSHRGLDALSLVAAEGETAAILGLHEVSALCANFLFFVKCTWYSSSIHFVAHFVFTD